MDNFIYPNFYTGSDNNYGKYSNTEVDKAIDEARQTKDDDERRSKYREINKKIGEDLPIAPIMFYAHNHVGSDRVQKMYYDPQGKADLGNASVTA
jgi:peptide/nickel transport system substrate-binding protein/oligopeptide transport system substrate-binding protein